MKRLARLFSQCIIIALITLLLIELALQGLALIVKSEGRGTPESWASNNLRVLALGDSNTYGLYLDEAQAYPAQLQQYWNNRKQADLPAIEVINLGYPGTNSSRILANFDQMLERFQPDFVLVMIGANDFWTPAEPTLATPRETILSNLKKWSRVYRLYYMLRRETFDRAELATAKRTDNLDKLTNAETSRTWEQAFSQYKAHPEVAAAPAAPLEYGGESFDLKPDQKGVASATLKHLGPNLIALKGIADAHGARLILLTYAANINVYGIANQVLREVSHDQHFDLIDVGKEFSVDCPQAHASCESLFFHDDHLRSKGYQRMAEFAAEKLEQLFRAM